MGRIPLCGAVALFLSLARPATGDATYVTDMSLIGPARSEIINKIFYVGYTAPVALSPETRTGPCQEDKSAYKVANRTS